MRRGCRFLDGVVRLHVLRGGPSACTRCADGACRARARDAPGGRVLAVEPDNAARYWFSSIPSGMEAFELGRRFFTALALARGEAPPAAIGPALPGLFSAAGIDAAVGGPVSRSPDRMSARRRPPSGRAARKRSRPRSRSRPTIRCGASAATMPPRSRGTAAKRPRPDPAFVEIQNAMLFASVGQRPDSHDGRVAGLGRLRALLRLGERAHAAAARRGVLAAAGGGAGRTRSRTRMRDRTHRRSGRAGRRPHCRHRSLG